MPKPGNVHVTANSTLLAVIPQQVTMIGDPFLLAQPIYRYANLDLPFSPNDPGLQFTLTGVDPLVHSTLAARFFNLLDEFSAPLFLGGAIKPVNPPVIFEPPLRMCLSGVPEIWTVVSDSDPNYGGCFPQFSTDFTQTWQSPVDITGSSIIFGNATTGEVTYKDFPAHVDVDADDTLSLDLSESLGTLAAYGAGDRDNFRYPSYLANQPYAAVVAQIASGGIVPCGGTPTFSVAISPDGGGGNGPFAGECVSQAGNGEGSSGGMELTRGPVISSLDPILFATAFQTFPALGSVGLSADNVCDAFIAVIGSKTDAPFFNDVVSAFCRGQVDGCIWDAEVPLTTKSGVWAQISGPNGLTSFTNGITIFRAGLDSPDDTGVTARQALQAGSVQVDTSLGASLIGGCSSAFGGQSVLLLYMNGGAQFIPSSGGGSLAANAGTTSGALIGIGVSGAAINYELIAHSSASGGIVSGGMVLPISGANLVSVPGPSGFGGPIRRAVFSMPVPGFGSDHPLGIRYAWLDDRLSRKPPGIMKIPLDAAWIGRPLAFRFGAFGQKGGFANIADAQVYYYLPSGLAFNQFSPQPTYVQTPAQALSQTDANTIQMASVTEAFAGNTIRYNARTLNIATPAASGTVYYVTIYDPNLLGDVGQALTRQAYIDLDQTRVQTYGYVYIGSIVALPEQFQNVINTDGGWPPPRYMLVNGT